MNFLHHSLRSLVRSSTVLFAQEYVIKRSYYKAHAASEPLKRKILTFCNDNIFPSNSPNLLCATFQIMSSGMVRFIKIQYLLCTVFAKPLKRSVA